MSESVFFFVMCVPWIKNHVIWLRGRHLYPQSHLSGFDNINFVDTADSDSVYALLRIALHYGNTQISTGLTKNWRFPLFCSNKKILNKVQENIL